MANNNVSRLFVYGTLMPGEINHHYLQGIDGVWERAMVRGKLYPEGIGLAAGYPALLLPVEGSSDAGEISGWLFASQHLENHWHVLDTFEGIAYQRLIIPVKTLDNIPVDAYVYVLAENSDI